MWITRSTQTRSNIILGTTKRCTEPPGNQTVAKLIEMFESHQHKEQFLKDMSQTQKINRFSKASQKMLQDVRILRKDCNSFTEIGIICCSCGRNLKYKRSLTTNQKANNDFTSVPGYNIKKNSSRGPKHGQSERQLMFFKAKDMQRKAKMSKNGSHPTILSRWKAQESYRTSSANHNIGEKEIMLCDQIALENHDYIATKAERIQHSKHWVLSINADDLNNCEVGGIVQGDEGPIFGAAQVFCHGVTVEVGYQEEGQEEEVEKQEEVEGEEKQLKDNRTSWMVWRWGE